MMVRYSKFMQRLHCTHYAPDIDSVAVFVVYILKVVVPSPVIARAYFFTTDHYFVRARVLDTNACTLVLKLLTFFCTVKVYTRYSNLSVS